MSEYHHPICYFLFIYRKHNNDKHGQLSKQLRFFIKNNYIFTPHDVAIRKLNEREHVLSNSSYLFMIFQCRVSLNCEYIFLKKGGGGLKVSKLVVYEFYLHIRETSKITNFH
jgi:hypothetical protein